MDILCLIHILILVMVREGATRVEDDASAKIFNEYMQLVSQRYAN